MPRACLARHGLLAAVKIDAKEVQNGFFVHDLRYTRHYTCMSSCTVELHVFMHVFMSSCTVESHAWFVCALHVACFRATGPHFGAWVVHEKSGATRSWSRWGHAT